MLNFWAKLFCDYGNTFICAGGVLNAICFGFLVRRLKKIDKMINPKASMRYGIQANMVWKREDVAKISKMRRGAMCGYAFYANMTAIFPLLGILGTVAALVTYSSETMMENFMVALSTTLYGVLLAIIFKFLDAFVSGPLDIVVEEVEHIIQDSDNEVQKSNEA